MTERGQNLVIVPCWWSGDKERCENIINMSLINISLIASIRLLRPDLLLQYGMLEILFLWPNIQHQLAVLMLLSHNNLRQISLLVCFFSLSSIVTFVSARCARSWGVNACLFYP